MNECSVNGSLNEETGRIIPIVFSTNDLYAPYAGVAIQSVILNANAQNIYRIYVLHTSVSEKHVAELESLSTENAIVQCLNIEDLVSKIDSPLPVVATISKEAYYRILIPEIEVFQSYPYVIYLDCDIVVNRDIAGIIPHSMGDYLICGVIDHYQMNETDRTRLERDFQLDASQYINSGVLVMNIPQWIQEKKSQECFDFLRDISSSKYVFMDQDIINAVCKNRIMYLDETWNYNWFIRFGDALTVERCKEITDRIGESFHVLHYTTSQKPWFTLDHPYAHYFWEYARQSPFFEEILKANLCSKAELEDNMLYIRIGRIITFLPRKMLGGIKCIREHGAGYSLRRTLYHLGLWVDEEAPEGSDNRPKLVIGVERLLTGKRK